MLPHPGSHFQPDNPAGCGSEFTQGTASLTCPHHTPALPKDTLAPHRPGVLRECSASVGTTPALVPQVQVCGGRRQGVLGGYYFHFMNFPDMRPSTPNYWTR